jgi:hypothetical protein
VALAQLLAHQGGWDEVFFVAAPLVVFAGLLLLAKRRAEKMIGSRSGTETASGDIEPADEA